MFDELQVLESLIEKIDSNPIANLRTHRVASVEWNNLIFPIDAIEIGSESLTDPCIGFFSGVHGVERIGAQVVLAFLESIVERLHWDESLQGLLAHTKLVFMPIINPMGIFQQSRCNGNDVDLMRNAPIDAEVKVLFLVGVHRLSRS